MSTKKSNIIWPDYVLDNIADLRSERSARYMTRSHFADVVGLSYTSIADYEELRHWPNQVSYNKIARYLGWRIWK